MATDALSAPFGEFLETTPMTRVTESSTWSTRD